MSVGGVERDAPPHESELDVSSLLARLQVDMTRGADRFRLPSCLELAMVGVQHLLDGLAQVRRLAAGDVRSPRLPDLDVIRHRARATRCARRTKSPIRGRRPGSLQDSSVSTITQHAQRFRRRAPRTSALPRSPELGHSFGVSSTSKRPALRWPARKSQRLGSTTGGSNEPLVRNHSERTDCAPNASS
jgi:hypothetical protein